jgi:nitrogen fixation protein FixH
MKLNWGSGIAIVYTIFALAMLFAVYQSTKQDNSLVVENYYQKDLEYQTQIDKEVNTQGLLENLQIKYAGAENAVNLLFPTNLGPISGVILFFRPSNKALDFEMPIQMDAEGRQQISTQKLLPGLWKVQVNWSAAGKDYYTEETIVW